MADMYEYRETAWDDNSKTEKRKEETTFLSPEEIANFCMVLSGKDENGDSNSVVSYMSYALEDAEDSISRTSIYSARNASIELAFNKQDPRFYIMDIIFKSYDDPELKLMWGRLQQFKRNWVVQPDKTWIFYIQALERHGVTIQTLEKDTLVTGNIFNPTYFNLTREVPNYLATENITADGELYGGNVIRMLIPVELVNFEVSNAIDTSEIKGEVQREMNAVDYLDNATDAGENW